MPSSELSASDDAAHDRPLAPAWHTAALVILMLAVAVAGTVLGGPATTSPRTGAGGRLFSAYLPMLVVQWGLLAYVCRIGRPRSALAELVGRGWGTYGRAMGDVSLAIAAGMLIEALGFVLGRYSHAGQAAAVVRLLPSGVGERLAWAVVAMSVGFCEEVVYRGYLRTQLTRFTRNAAAGTILQAVLFGIAHAEQGSAAALRITVYGLLLGALAACRRSLIPGILCHVGLDLVSGLAR